MKITIELEGSGAEARQQLLDLLGQNYFVGIDPARKSEDKTVITTMDNVVITDVQEMVAEAEKTTGIVKETRTRKTKAQLEAEKAAEAAKEEPTEQEDKTAEQQEDKASEKPAEIASKVTIPDLQKKSVELGRSGKRDAVKEILNKYGAESFTSTKPLAPEHFDAVMEELEKL